MSIIATSEGTTQRQLPPSGAHPARAVQMIYLGTHTKDWQGESKQKKLVRITWELPTELAEFKEGEGEQPFIVSKTYTLSLHEKAALRKDLESWRGKAFTEAEAQGFDVAVLLGKECLLGIIHATKGDKTYANISSISRLPKGMVCPPAINPLVEYSVTSHNADVFNNLPEFIQKQITESAEWKASRSGSQRPAATEPEPEELAPDHEPDGDPEW